MDVSLPPQLEDFIRSQVRSGRYADEQEVVRDALRQMRTLVRAAEDPTISGLLRDAIGLANQAQRDVTGLLQSAERETSVLGDVVKNASAVTTAAFDVVRKVPGARELEKIVRVPLEGVTIAAQQGEYQARAMRTNLEATAKALGVLSVVLERVNAASRTVNNAIAPGNSQMEHEVVVEIPKGSRNKYEMDHDSGVIYLDRTLFTSMQYPGDYGFFPDTLADDGDPLDALVLLAEPTFPGCRVITRAIAVFWMTDEKGADAKVLCVPSHDPRWNDVRDLPDVDSHLLAEIAHFFEFYKTIEPGKDTSTRGWEGAAQAENAIETAKAAYRP